MIHHWKASLVANTFDLPLKGTLAQLIDIRNDKQDWCIALATGWLVGIKLVLKVVKKKEKGS